VIHGTACDGAARGQPPRPGVSLRRMADVSIPSGKTLVTGAGGHVGANLVHRLLADGDDVRVLVQPGANNRAVDGLPVEVVEGDLRDVDACARAVDGCARVYHVAARISTLNPSANEQRDLFAINVLGTRNIMQQSLRHDVARVVLTGSFSAVGYDPASSSTPSTEDMPFYPFEGAMPYAHTKALAELEMLKAVVDGLDAVIATSCACVGPHDYIPSRMGRTMCDYVKGKFKVYIDGGFEFVRAGDLVDGHIRAMEKGAKGQKYVFSTAHHSLEEMVHIWSDVTGLPPARIKLPAALMSGITGLYAGSLAKMFPKIPQRLTPGAIRILRLRRRADTTRAREELGWQPTSMKLAAQEAFEFFAEQGMLPRERLVSVPAPQSTEAAQ
jgi:nucleoside-diphosphate-sugar epimerase